MKISIFEINVLKASRLLLTPLEERATSHKLLDETYFIDRDGRVTDEGSRSRVHTLPHITRLIEYRPPGSIRPQMMTGSLWFSQNE